MQRRLSGRKKIRRTRVPKTEEENVVKERRLNKTQVGGHWNAGRSSGNLRGKAKLDWGKAKL